MLPDLTLVVRWVRWITWSSWNAIQRLYWSSSTNFITEESCQSKCRVPKFRVALDRSKTSVLSDAKRWDLIKQDLVTYWVCSMHNWTPCTRNHLYMGSEPKRHLTLGSCLSKPAFSACRFSLHLMLHLEPNMWHKYLCPRINTCASVQERKSIISVWLGISTVQNKTVAPLITEDDCTIVMAMTNNTPNSLVHSTGGLLYIPFLPWQCLEKCKSDYCLELEITRWTQAEKPKLTNWNVVILTAWGH
jgi:hypothetical protein